jgi:hypothetical protein
MYWRPVNLALVRTRLTCFDILSSSSLPWLFLEKNYNLWVWYPAKQRATKFIGKKCHPSFYHKEHSYVFLVIGSNSCLRINVWEICRRSKGKFVFNPTDWEEILTWLVCKEKVGKRTWIWYYYITIITVNILCVVLWVIYKANWRLYHRTPLYKM